MKAERREDHSAEQRLARASRWLATTEVDLICPSRVAVEVDGRRHRLSGWYRCDRRRARLAVDGSYVVVISVALITGDTIADRDNVQFHEAQDGGGSRQPAAWRSSPAPACMAAKRLVAAVAAADDDDRAEESRRGCT